MSLSAKVKMSPLEGTRNGQTTGNERQRTEPVGSDAAIVANANEPKRSRQDVELECTPDQTVAERVSARGSGGLGLQASWAARK